MATLQNTFDSGTAGTSITAGNSGGANGDAFAVTGTGRTFNADALHGALSADFTLASGDPANYAQWAWTNHNQFISQFYFKLVQNVTATSGFFIIRGGGSAVVQLAINSAREVTVLTGSGSANRWTTAALTLGTWYRFDISGQVGATTSTGILNVDYYAGDSGTPVETGLAITDANLGTGGADQLRVGWQATVASVRQCRIDSLRLKHSEGTTYLTPFGANQAPTVSLAAFQNVSAGATVTATATPSDVDGTIASHAWNVVAASSTATPTLTGSTTATVTFTAPAAGNLVTLRYVATDDDGATVEAFHEVRVPATGNFTTLALDGTTTNGTWTRAGAATTDGAALADSDNSTYTQSPDYTALATTEEYRLQPITARSSLTLTPWTAQPVAGGTTTMSLVEGTTVRQTWTLSPPSGTTPGSQTCTVDNPAAISDWGNLRVRFSGVS